jgi:hypothetical protein
MWIRQELTLPEVTKHSQVVPLLLPLHSFFCFRTGKEGEGGGDKEGGEKEVLRLVSDRTRVLGP